MKEITEEELAKKHEEIKAKAEHRQQADQPSPSNPLSYVNLDAMRRNLEWSEAKRKGPTTPHVEIEFPDTPNLRVRANTNSTLPWIGSVKIGQVFDVENTPRIQRFVTENLLVIVPDDTPTSTPKAFPWSSG